jgi:hypothetical protein
MLRKILNEDTLFLIGVTLTVIVTIVALAYGVVIL